LLAVAGNQGIRVFAAATGKLGHELASLECFRTARFSKVADDEEIIFASRDADRGQPVPDFGTWRFPQNGTELDELLHVPGGY
jgi:hypothetical protein